MRGIWSARECYCAVRVTVRRRWYMYDIVMLSSCALSEGVPGVRFFTLLRMKGSEEPRFGTLCARARAQGSRELAPSNSKEPVRRTMGDRRGRYALVSGLYGAVITGSVGTRASAKKEAPTKKAGTTGRSPRAAAVADATRSK